MTEYSYPDFLEVVLRHRGRDCWVEALLGARANAEMREWQEAGRRGEVKWIDQRVVDWQRFRDCDGELDAHHVAVSKQRIKQKFHPDDDRRGEALMDPRNGVPCCRRHHDLLERRLVVPTRAELPEDAVEFAGEIGMLGWVERDYPEAA
jgi:hypothetical protein